MPAVYDAVHCTTVLVYTSLCWLLHFTIINAALDITVSMIRVILRQSY
jgi:hypothetical protein